jgi:trans-aconitate methyltransferase
MFYRGTHAILTGKMTLPDKSLLFLWNAVDYHQSSPAQRQWAQELIDKLQIRGNEHILDIGCGDGKVTAEIARHLPEGEVVGIDASPEMIRFALEHFPPTRFPNLSFAEMAAQAMTFRERFDVVFSNAALHWIPDHRPVLAGISDALHPGGRLLIQMGAGAMQPAYLRRSKHFGIILPGTAGLLVSPSPSGSLVLKNTAPGCLRRGSNLFVSN